MKNEYITAEICGDHLIEYGVGREIKRINKRKCQFLGCRERARFSVKIIPIPNKFKGVLDGNQWDQKMLELWKKDHTL